MENPFFSLCIVALAATPLASAAADAGDIAEIRKEIKAIKDGYEARIQALEARLKDAEAKVDQAAAATAPVAAAPAASPVSVAAGRPVQSAANAFNPATSLVLQGRYANLSQDPNRYAISGFQTGGDIGPGKRGFNLSESELTLNANVDDKFYANATLSVTPENRISAEEAYILTTALPAGVNIKAGRFFSGIGYQNEQHQHVWDFIDAPLAYQAFLNTQYGQDGVQLKWLAPTDLFIELGAELGNGESFPGTGRNKNGANAASLTARVGGDIGFSTSWLTGLSVLRTRADNRESLQIDSAGNNALTRFTGKSRVGIADFVVKWAPDGNPLVTNFKLQGEYFRRLESGDLTFDANSALGAINTDAYRANQSGWYMQGVYQFQPYWRIGLRYDRLDPGSVDYFSNGLNLASTGFRPNKTSLMVDWSPSEFSRVRLQAARDNSQPGLADNQLFLQYIMTIGAHGAHKF